MDVEFFATADEFEAWLEANGADADEVLVRMAKKHTGVASLDWAGAVDVALCFGWIDGRSRRIDDDWFVQRFTPRRSKSMWSKVNRQKVEALIAAGRMRPAGLAEIERAKADGRWEAAYDGMATSEVPAEGPRRGAQGGRPHRRVRGTQPPEPLRDPAPRADGQEGRDTRAQIAKYVGMLAAGETPCGPSIAPGRRAPGTAETWPLVDEDGHRSGSPAPGCRVRCASQQTSGSWRGSPATRQRGRMPALGTAGCG